MTNMIIGFILSLLGIVLAATFIYIGVVMIVSLVIFIMTSPVILTFLIIAFIVWGLLPRML